MASMMTEGARLANEEMDRARAQRSLDKIHQAVSIDLRDRFAMAALIGLLAAREWPNDNDSAKNAFKIADAMLAARKRGSADG